MNNKWARVVFWALVAVFIVIVLAIFALFPLTGWLPGFIFMAGIAVFFLLGIALLVMTVKLRIEALAGRFLLLTGSSAAGVLVFAVLHNIVSGLLGIEEAVFFTLATLVCPLGFLVGAGGVIVLMVKNKKHRSERL